METIYLKRKIDDFLLKWKADNDRKPLIVKGCRQIGKTESIRHFAKVAGYDSFIEINFVKDEKYSNVDEKVITENLQKDIANVLGTLKPAEEKVIRLRYGLDGEKPMSLAQVGEECNLTKERIRQIEKKAIVRMQHPVRKNRLEVYVA